MSPTRATDESALVSSFVVNRCNLILRLLTANPNPSMHKLLEAIARLASPADWEACSVDQLTLSCDGFMHIHVVRGNSMSLLHPGILMVKNMFMSKN